MYIDKITRGNHFPNDMNVIIEMSMHQGMVKYEMDKASGALQVDRFMPAAMHYPCNYGFVPHTCAGDGDPVDVLVITTYPILASTVIPSRAIGLLRMEDEAGADEKIIALPIQKIAPETAHIEDIGQIDKLLKEQIIHFFSHYKDLEPGKWVKIDGFHNREKALAFLTATAKQE